jgi:hypothetical protein
MVANYRVCPTIDISRPVDELRLENIGPTAKASFTHYFLAKKFSNDSK